VKIGRRLRWRSTSMVASPTATNAAATTATAGSGELGKAWMCWSAIA